MAEVVAAAGKLGLEVVTSEIRRAEDIAPAIDTFKGRADALYVCGDAFAYTNRNRINTLALGARLPAVHGNRDYIDAGGLMSYGPNIPDLYRRAADFVDKILRGAKPAENPGRAAVQVRSRHQPDHRQGARPDHAAHDARPC
jgi:putative ABC transport system substrate-binding protein